MTADEWELIKTLFERALQLPEEQRHGYLAEACGQRETVLRTVLELLEHHITSPTVAPVAAQRSGRVLQPGEVVAERLRVVRFIAAGGMGEVYEVYDELLKTRLALKVLRAELLDEPGARERFQREVVTARGVSHQNLCRVYDFVEYRRVGGSGAETVLPCLTMELLDGVSLAEHLTTKRPLAWAEALRWIREIGAALDVLHQQGMVHRDLKPSNVMLARRREDVLQAVVMDFGLAKSIDQDPNIFETRVEWAAGSPYFMAPELLRHGRATVASDIYSFGLLIDEMVTKTRAYPSRSLAEIYYAKLWEQPIPPGQRADGLPGTWASIIERCGEREPGNRPRSAGEVVAALEQQAVAGLPDRRRFLRAAPFAVGAAAIVGAVTFALSRVSTSVDVFDIENRTGQKELDYLCKGTVQEVLRRLQQLATVRVAPVRMGRVSSPAAKTTGRFLLSGVLETKGTGTALRMELTNGETGEAIWTRTFAGREIGSPLTLQDQIAHGVATALEDRLLYRATDRRPAGLIAGVAAPIRNLFGYQLGAGLGQTPTGDNRALDAYMRGSNLLEEVSGPSTRAAIEHFERAISLDPQFALAYAAIAQGYLALMSYDYVSEKEYRQRAKENAERAVQMGPDLAEAHAVLAAVLQADWDWEGSEREYREALRLKPSFARVHRWYAGLVIQFARFEEGLQSVRRAMELDPYDRAAPTSYGLYLFYAGRYQEAIDVFERSMAGREVPGTRFNLGQVYARVGYLSRGSESRKAYEEALRQAEILIGIANREVRLHGGSPHYFGETLRAMVFILSNSGEAATAMQPIEEAATSGKLPIEVMAEFRCLQGRLEESVGYLEQIYQRREQGLNYIRVDPFLERLRGTPRFTVLLKQLKLQ